MRLPHLLRYQSTIVLVKLVVLLRQARKTILNSVVTVAATISGTLCSRQSLFSALGPAKLIATHRRPMIVESLSRSTTPTAKAASFRASRFEDKDLRSIIGRSSRPAAVSKRKLSLATTTLQQFKTSLTRLASTRGPDLSLKCAKSTKTAFVSSRTWRDTCRVSGSWASWMAMVKMDTRSHTSARR